jgi:cob(I)alamin adenosyltransferase
LVALKDLEQLNPITVQYINRLSDLLFILARSIAHQDCGSEVYWRSKYSRLSEE